MIVPFGGDRPHVAAFQMLARMVHEAVRRRRAGRGTLMTGTSAAAKLNRSTFAENHFLGILYDFVWLAAALCRMNAAVPDDNSLRDAPTSR